MCSGLKVKWYYQATLFIIERRELSCSKTLLKTTLQTQLYFQQMFENLKNFSYQPLALKKLIADSQQPKRIRQMDSQQQR